jgi:uncharacterized RDD family membrane protein YckC
VLAGLGSRFIARLLDTLIQLAMILALSIPAAVLTQWSGFTIAGFVITLFLVMFFYDVPFEVWGGGRTPGKRALGIRVVGAGGERVDFLSSTTRNVARLVDFLPIFYLVGSISIVATAHAQRLGDIAGGTVVMRDRFSRMAAPLYPVPLTVPPPQVAAWDVSAVNAADVQVLRHFLDRRISLPWEVRSYFASELCRRYWYKVPGLPLNTHPEYILEGIVVAKQSRT